MRAARSSGPATSSSETIVSEYGPSEEGDDVEGWHRSPFYYLLQSGESEMRRRLEAGETEGFNVLDELRLEGQTDYLALVQRVRPRGGDRRNGLFSLALD